MAEPLVVLRGVTKAYGTTVLTPALRGIDLEFGRGEFVALTGPSGSGKSTLLNLIGLLDRPTSGSIRLAGTETTSLDGDGLGRFRGRTIGFVFQFHHLLPAFTALENVVMPSFADQGRLTPAVRDRGAFLLEQVGLGGLLNRRPSELSGGQQQRVALARALVMDPALLLADEPTGNLDTRSGEQVLELLRRLNVEQGITCVIVTHDDRIADRCDRNIHLVDGLVDFDRRRDTLAPAGT